MNGKLATLFVTAVAVGVISWTGLRPSRVAGKVFGDRVGASRLAIVNQQSTTQRSLGAPGTTGTPGGHQYLYIQAVRYKPEVTTAHIDELLRSMEESLSKIPEIKSIRSCRVVGDNRQFDYAVLMEFDSLEDEKNYANSEIHRRWVKEHVTPGLAQDFSRMTIDMKSAR